MKKPILVGISVIVIGIASIIGGGFLWYSTIGETPTNTLIAAFTYEQITFNPNYDFDGGIYHTAVGFLYDKLIGFDCITNELFPSLAESWEASEDLMTYTLHIREGVKFHDGVEFTAEDVKWNLESVIKENGVAATKLKTVESVEAPDKTTVIIHLSEPHGVLPYVLAEYYTVYMLPKHIYEGTNPRENPANFEPIGTGPFKLKEYVKGSHLKWVANEDYWGEGPYVDEFIIKIIPNRATIMLALEAGEIDLSIASITIPEAPRLERLPDIKLSSKPWTNPQYFGFNLNDTKFSDLRVRKAIAMAIDRNEINEKIFGGLTTNLYNPYTSVVSWAFNPDAKLPEKDLEQAEKLLDEAGYPRGADGIRFKTRITAPRGVSTYAMDLIPELLKGQLYKIGIDLEIEILESPLWKQKLYGTADIPQDVELGLAAGLQAPNPDVFRDFVSTEGFRNFMHYSNPRVDELFDLATKTIDKDQRAIYYFEMQEILAEEIPIVKMVEQPRVVAFSTKFDGYWFQDIAIGRLHHDQYQLVKPTEVAPARASGPSTEVYILLGLGVILVISGAVYIYIKNPSTMQAPKLN